MDGWIRQAALLCVPGGREHTHEEFRTSADSLDQMVTAQHHLPELQRMKKFLSIGQKTSIMETSPFRILQG